MQLTPTGMNLFKPAKPSLVHPPTPQPGVNGPEAGAFGTKPQPADQNPTDKNVAPPGSPLPVGNGISPGPGFVPGMGPNDPPWEGKIGPTSPIPLPTAGAPSPAVLNRGSPTSGTPPGAPEYSPTGLNFGLGHDLRSSVIQPGADPRLAAASATTDASVAAVGGVDRRKSAQDILSQFDKASVDPLREAYRGVGQQAASLGRLGMGSTAQDVQEVGRKHLTDRATLETNLAAQTASQEAQDRLDKAHLARGVEGDIYGYGAGNRGELRGERGYQFGTAETATDRAVQQAQLEEALKNGQMNRGIALGEYGQAGNPVGAELGAAGVDQAQSGADIGSIAELLRRYGYSSATKAAA